MNENTQIHLVEVLSSLNQNLTSINKEIVNVAVQMLREDLHNPELTGPKAAPDDYVTRANNVAFLYLRNNSASNAELLYQILIEETLRHSKETNTRRHLGALYANKGVAYALQGNLDQAVVEFLRAFEEDKVAYGPARERSFAMITLLPRYFISPLQTEILKLGQLVNPTVTIAEIEKLCTFLGSLAYAFIAYVKLYLVHNEAIQVSDNFYSKLQILSALRNICALFEIELKIKSGLPDSELISLITSIHKTDSWWKTFVHTKERIKGTRKSPRTIDDELQNSLTIPTPDEDTLFWKSILIAYITRNHTVHQMDTTTNLINQYHYQVISHLIYAMIKATP